MSSEYKIPDNTVILSTSDKYGNITSCNESFVIVSGYHYEELIGQAHHILRHPNTPSSLFFDLWHTIQQGHAWFGVIKNKRKNGDYYWVAANVSPIFDGDEIKGYVSVRYPATNAQKEQAERSYYRPGQSFPSTPAPQIPYLHAIFMLAVIGVAGVILPIFNLFPELVGKVITLSAIPIGFIFYLIASKPNKQQNQAIKDLSSGNFHNPFIGNDHWTQAINLLRIRIAQNASDQSDENYRQEKRFAETLTLLDETIIELDIAGRISYHSNNWQVLTDTATQHSDSILEYIHSEDREDWLQHIRALKTLHKHTFQCCFRLNTNKNNLRWIEGRFFAYTDPQGHINIRGVLRDITQKQLQDSRLTHIALHDNLTGLANRTLLEDRTNQAIHLAQRTEQLIAIIFFDIDHFKPINDNLGHEAGDQILIAVAERLTHCLRSHDTFARWGGDEFILVIERIQTQSEILTLTQKLQDATKAPFSVLEQSVNITLSMGVACYPYDGEDKQTLYINADKAMYQAKRNGRNQVCFYKDIKANL